MDSPARPGHSVTMTDDKPTNDTSPPLSVTGTVAVVTGATGGIGKEIARGLARAGATVVIAARDPVRGETTRAEFAADRATTGELTVMKLDVADQASVRAFAKGIRDRFGSVGILVNNAGAWFSDRRRSPDGVELTLATNVLGPYLLTNELLEPLRAAGRARIVNVVSSIAGNYDVADLQFTTRPYDGYRAYGQSKQALYMLTWGQAARLDGTGVTANAASPGFVKTDFNRNARGFRTAMINLSARLFAVPASKGADTPLWVATAPELAGVTGKYFEGRQEKAARFRDPGPIGELEAACDKLVAQGLTDHH
jgi:NAD(P)-dependent dehydrogenase (short-subunit alcohol dehydrogenase family)